MNLNIDLKRGEKVVSSLFNPSKSSDIFVVTNLGNIWKWNLHNKGFVLINQKD